LKLEILFVIPTDYRSRLFEIIIFMNWKKLNRLNEVFLGVKRIEINVSD
jgi:hypothetical protein